MYLTLGQAAKKTRKSKSTISKALSSGRLSAHSKTSRGYEIDPAELFRVFPMIEQGNGKNEQSETPKTNTETHYEIKVLEVQLEAAHEKIKTLEDDKEDYKSRLDSESKERGKLFAQLTDERLATPKKMGFFKRFSRKQ